MVNEEVKRRLRSNRNWRRLWAAQAVSLVGDFVFDTTVVLWIAAEIAKGKPWAPAAVSGALIAAALPVLLIGPLTGVFVDRWDRRRTMMTADACRALLIAGLLALPAAGDAIAPAAQLAVLYSTVAAESCFAQFFNPSRIAILGLVVEPDDRAKASGLLQATSSFAAILGPPLAAPLLFTFGVQWALLIDAASFVISFLLVAGIRVTATQSAQRQAGSDFRAEFRAGLRFFAGNQVLIMLCVEVIIVTLGAGALNVLIVFFVTDNLHVAASWVGTLLAGEGAGAIAGALLAGWLAGRIGSGRVLWLGLIACGVVLLGFSRTTMLGVAAAVIVLAGVAIGAVNSVYSPLLLGTTPQQFIGRVMAVITPLQQLAGIVAMVAASFLASTVLRGLHVTLGGVTFGPIDTIFAGAALLFVLGGVAAIRPLRGTAAAPRVADQPTGPPEALGAGADG